MFDIMPLGEQLERWHGGIEDAAYEPLNDENQPWEDFGYNDSGITVPVTMRMTMNVVTCRKKKTAR
jgi:hypothetical protein